MDAYVHLNACSSSFAVVVHDEFGIVLYGFPGFYPSIVSPLVAEAVALRETLRWLFSLNWLSIETESQFVCQRILSSAVDRSKSSLIIAGRKTLLMQSSNFFFTWISRHANMVAHICHESLFFMLSSTT